MKRRSRSSSSSLCIGAATVFVALATVLSLGDDPGGGRAPVQLRGTLAPEVAAGY